MVVREFTIQNKLGIHARPAAMFVKVASQYKSTVRVHKDGLDVNGKSIMGIMMLAAAKGNVIQVVAEGCDAEDVVEALGRIVHDKFGEE